MAGISSITKDRLGSSGPESHDGENWSFWDGVADSFSNLWNWISGKDDRDFAQSQADEAFERQKWLDLNEPSLQIEGMRRAGMNPGLMTGSPQISTPQIATANRLAPSLSDVAGLLTGISSNILQAKKVSAEADLMDKQGELAQSQVAVNSGMLKVLESQFEMNSGQAKWFAQQVEESKERIENLKVQNEYLRWHQPLLKAQAYKTSQEGISEAWKRPLWESEKELNWSKIRNTEKDTQKKEAEISNISTTTKVVKFNLDHILPRTAQEIGSRIDLNQANAGFMKQQTLNLVQDFWIKKPEADYVANHIDLMVKKVGAEKALKYWESLSDALDAGIQYDRRSQVPDNPFHGSTPYIPGANDGYGHTYSGTKANIYNSIMNFLTNITQDMAAPIGTGLGIKRLTK